MNLTVKETHQRFAEVCGYKNITTWDEIEESHADILKAKIKVLFPNSEDEKIQKYIMEIRDLVFRNVWRQRKYTNGDSISSIFYVIFTREKDFNLVMKSKDYSIHPVFRTRKCSVNGDGVDTTNCCMIYIDEIGRVYNDFKSYCKENKLPPGMMVLPTNGVYTFDEQNTAEYVIYTTPSAEPNAQIWNAVNQATSYAGFAAAVVPIAGFLVPVAAPVLLASSIVGGAVGATSTFTSSKDLIDRKNHGESISVMNNKAARSWLGVVSGTVGIGAMASTKILKSFAGAGKTTTGLENVVNGFNMATVVVNGTGVVNGFFHIFKNRNEEISTLDKLQLAASLILFTHSVYNFQLASRIVDEVHSSRISDYHKTLSSRQKKIFEKLSKETIRIRGGTKGKMDIVRNIHNIPDKQYLNNLYKIKKTLNQSNVRPAFNSEGTSGIVLNEQLSVNSDVLRQSVQHGKGPNILENITKPIPPTCKDINNSIDKKCKTKLPRCDNVIQNHTNQTSHLLNEKIINNLLAIVLKPNTVIDLRKFGKTFCDRIGDMEKFTEFIKDVYNECGEKMLDIIFHLTQSFLNQYTSANTESIFNVINWLIKQEFGECDAEYVMEQSYQILCMLDGVFKVKVKSKNFEGNKICPKCKGYYKETSLTES